MLKLFKNIILIILFLSGLSIAQAQDIALLKQQLDSLINIQSDKALSTAKQLEKLAKQKSSKEDLAFAYSSMAKIHYEKKHYNKAIKYFEKDLKLLENTIDDKLLAEEYYNLGSTCLKINKKTKAVKNFEISLKKSKALNNRGLIQANYNALVITNEKLSQYKKALFYFKLLMELEQGEFVDKIDLYKKQAVKYKKISKKTKVKLKKTKIVLNQVNKSLDTATQTIGFLEEDTLKKHKEIKSLNLEKQLKDVQLKFQKNEITYRKKILKLLIFGLSIISVLAIIVFILMLLKRRINQELRAQKKEIVKQNEAIKQSILYARRIQNAVLPKDILFKEYFTDYFIIFKPRDIVSGDFYFLQKVNHYIVFAAVDSTGHGVPGAFMSMLGGAFLNEIIRKDEITQANQVLNLLREEIKTSLHQTGKKGEQKDGMDMAICVINTQTNELQYAGAHNPLILVRKGELIEYKADRMPIGIYRKEKEFTNHTFKLENNDKLYVYSDGFADQIGEQNRKKYKSRKLKAFIRANAHLPMSEQKKLLETEFENWKGNLKQIDDMVMIGIEI